MENWKTSAAGLVVSVSIIARAFGVDVPQPVLDVVTAIATAMLGYLASDRQKAPQAS